MTATFINKLNHLTDENILKWKTIPEYIQDTYVNQNAEVSSKFYDVIVPLAKSGMLYEYHSYCAQHNNGLIIILSIVTEPSQENNYNHNKYTIYVQPADNAKFKSLHDDITISTLLYSLLLKVKDIHDKLNHKPTTEEFINSILAL